MITKDDDIVYTQTLKFYKVIKIVDDNVICKDSSGNIDTLKISDVKGLPAMLKRQSGEK